VLIPVQHLLAEVEEGDRWYAIVLQGYALVRDGEGPFLSQIVGGVATRVLLLKGGVHLALPIYVAYHLAASQYARHVLFASGTILIEEQTRGTSLLDLLENL
jgi:hypothetical protein